MMTLISFFYSSESSKHKYMCKREEKPNEVEDKEQTEKRKKKRKTKNKELFNLFVVINLFLSDRDNN